MYLSHVPSMAEFKPPALYVGMSDDSFEVYKISKYVSTYQW